MALKMKCFDSYQDGLQLCFIIFNETNGSPEGKQLFIDICQKICTDFDEEECNKKWYSIKTSKDKKLTIATLYKKNYEMFPEERKQDKEKIYTNPDYISEKERFENIDEFYKSNITQPFQITSANINYMKETAIIMHPLPRLQEISYLVDNNDRCVYFNIM